MDIPGKLKVIPMLLTPILVSGSMLASTALAKEKSYAQDSARGVVVNSAGECWRTAGGVQSPRAECGDLIDSDGDGVTDDRDKCPGTPMGVKVDADGCALDSDGDGVPDYRDKCPGTPAGAPVDAQGCPLDSDGDGVADYMDKCPGTRAGAKVNRDGCEIIASITIDLVGGEFDVNSAVLKPAMRAALDDLAARIRTSAGDETLLIVGHTDSTGSDDYNQGLSERRAEAVAGYLSSKGINNARMTTGGRGEKVPIADNATAEGRSQNRRVEIRTQ